MLKKISLSMFVLSLALSLVTFSDTPCQAGWVKTYGGTGNDLAGVIQETSDGGHIMAGHTTSFGAGNSDIWLVKLDGEGNIAWQKTYGGPAREWLESILQTSDGYIVAGHTPSFGAGGGDGWILKIDGSGNVVWQKTYGGTGYDRIADIRQTSDGYIVAGYTTSFGAGGGDAWILKLDGSGNVTWQRTYGGTALDFASSIQQTSDGGYIVAGYTASFGAGSNDFWLMKLDGSGNVVWQKAYGGTGTDEPMSVLPTGDGYIVAGSTASFGAGSYDVWLMKLDGSGNVVWQKTYGGAEYDSTESILQTSDGYIVAGHTESFGAGSSDAWLVKLDEDGNVTWQRTYGGAKYDSHYSVQKILAGGYILAGVTQSFGGGSDDDALFIKLDESGLAGSCPFEGISTAIVSDTVATITETTAVTSTTTVVGVDTTVVPVDSTATTTVVCPFTGDIQLKVGSTRKRQGNGTVTTADGLIDCPGTCADFYPAGFNVTLYANPATLSTFIGWKPTPLGCEATNPICKITMDKKKSIKAVFQGPNKLKVGTTLKNGALGTVISGDGLINCPGDCEEVYILNAPVTLTATAGTDSRFVKWTGKPCKEVLINECTFNMEKNASVKAIFEPLD